MNLEPPRPPLPSFSASSSSCPLHPDLPVTGFCASCLRDRLVSLDSASRNRPAPSSSSASAALKAIFFRGDRSSRVKSSGYKNRVPELRRCKSFSAAKADGAAASLSFEPQRKSCDVRARSTLSSLFHRYNENRAGTSSFWGEIEEVEDPEGDGNNHKNARNNNAGSNDDRTTADDNLGFREVVGEIEELEEEEFGNDENNDGEIKVLQAEIESVSDPLVAEGKEPEIEEEVKTMKDHISLDAQARDQKSFKASAADKRDFKDIAGSFLLAASVFSKKLHKWRRRKKKREPSATSARVERARSSARCFRETQSEVADYGYGRRSCDTEPRFSLDAGRISFDDGRYSFDEPRASWDGYLIGRAPAAPPRMLPMMGSVVEDAPAPPRRSINQIPLEEEPLNPIEEDPNEPVVSVQAGDPAWENLERSASVRAAIEEKDGPAPQISNPKAFSDGVDFLPANKITDSKPFSAYNSLRDECSDSFESAYRDASAIAEGGVGQWKGQKKSRRWMKSWNIWGFILRRGAGKDDELVDRYSNVVERSFSECWPELRREANEVYGELRGAVNGRVLRSNSSVSWRSSSINANLGSNGIHSSRETIDQSKKKKEEYSLDHNHSSAGFSPSHFDNNNGVLSFYLTPLRSSLNGGVSGRSKSGNSYSFARSMLRMY